MTNSPTHSMLFRQPLQGLRQVTTRQTYSVRVTLQPILVVILLSSIQLCPNTQFMSILQPLQLTNLQLWDLHPNTPAFRSQGYSIHKTLEVFRTSSNHLTPKEGTTKVVAKIMQTAISIKNQQSIPTDILGSVHPLGMTKYHLIPPHRHLLPSHTQLLLRNHIIRHPLRSLMITITNLKDLNKVWWLQIKMLTISTTPR